MSEIKKYSTDFLFRNGGKHRLPPSVVVQSTHRRRDTTRVISLVGEVKGNLRNPLVSNQSLDKKIQKQFRDSNSN